ncbi:lysophospholipid acyltransferase family protein [Roseateles sp. BYS180W]|uniref:Lysophospholipid acyltransferase family protein n=1 Tax=Roseateles rivi TaxID=3299028 RepID=A0ABW7FQT8_9BURK
MAFTCFGLGGLLLTVLLVPLLNLLVWSQDLRRRWARMTVSLLFGGFIHLMVVLRLVTYEVHGRERLNRAGLLILANHPTLIDVVFLIWLVRNADCIVKAALWRNPCTRGPLRAAGYICNDAGEALVASSTHSMDQGGNLIIFPEGTRSRPGEALRLQRGAAHIATRARRDVTPVRIHCAPLGLYKGQRWWQVAPRPLHFRICVEDDIPVEPFLAEAAEPALAARRLTDHLTWYFSNGHASPARIGS